MTAPPANRNALWARVLVDELIRGGTAHACLSPGSRSAPLALALAERAGAGGDLTLSVHLDERSAAFFALGHARASGRPVVLACTSGSAGAHYLPAVVEAHYSRVPLVLLTADRPPELRGIGAWQTIDQLALFGPYVRWRAELLPAAPDAALLRDARYRAARAVALARGRMGGDGPGPVHLNVPFREPLDAAPVLGDVPADVASAALAAVGRDGGAPLVSVPEPARRLAQADVDALADRMASEGRGLILAGGLDAPAGYHSAVSALAEAVGWPILAEPTGGLRFGRHDLTRVITGYDAAVRSPTWSVANAPGVVLRLGASFAWKHVAEYLARHPAAHQVVVDPHGTWDDPTHLAAERLACDPEWLCRALAEAMRQRTARVQQRAEPAARWQAAWSAARAAAARTRAALSAGEPAAAGTAWLYPVVLDALPEGGLLWAANSMAVRDLDAWTGAVPKAIRAMASRGAAGIDGTLSTALGAALASGQPAVLVAGDLAFLHDAGGMAAARLPGIDLAIVVVDDDGGGIFEYLPSAATDRPAFEQLFATPQRADLAAACRVYGVPCTTAATPAELRRALSAHAGRVRVVVVPVERAANTAAHRAYWRAVAAELGDGAGRG